MAFHIYPSCKELLLAGDIDLIDDDLKVALLDNSYVYDTAHSFFSSITGQVGASSPNLTSKTITGGVFDAANTTINSVTGNQIVALVIYKDTGVASTSPLIFYADGLSVTPNGNNININWNASGIFSL